MSIKIVKILEIEVISNSYLMNSTLKMIMKDFCLCISLNIIYISLTLIYSVNIIF